MNDLIDRFRGWYPRETLLRLTQHGRNGHQVRRHPVEEMLVENLALKMLKGFRLLLTLIGLAALAVLYHKRGA